MNTTFIILSLVFFAFWYYQKLNKRNTIAENDHQLNNNEDDKPQLKYSIYALDATHQQKIQLHEIPDFPNQYGIIKGQVVEFCWQAINSKKIEIEGLGILNANGSHRFFKAENFTIEINVENPIESKKYKIDVHVFPTPILEKIIVPTPEIQFPTFNHISNLLQQVNSEITIPTIHIPTISSGIDHTKIAKPKLIEPIIIKQNKINFIDNKIKVLDQLEDKFADKQIIKESIINLKNKYIK